MNFCKEWGKDSNTNDIQSPLDEVIQKSVRIQSGSPTRVGRWSHYGFNESAFIGDRMCILIPVCVDRRGFLLKDPPTRRSLIHCLSRGIFSVSIHPTMWGEEGFSGTSELGIIIQILPHQLDVVPVTLWVVGIIHINICSIMFQTLTILLCGLTHVPPFIDSYLCSPKNPFPPIRTSS